MHDGCSGSFENGQQIVDKVRMMGFAEQLTPVPLAIKCANCDTPFEMETFEAQCPQCSCVHGVTPCHAFDPANVSSAGVGY